MEQYGTEKLFMISKVMKIFGNFIMQSVVIFYIVSSEVIKKDIKYSVKDSYPYLELDKQVCLCYIVVYVFT